MRTLIFDVDDTLYDQLVPFKKAFEIHFSYTDILVDRFYLSSRKLSDKVFHLTEGGLMSKEDMHIYRIKKAFEEFGIVITEDAAIAFQADYQKFQEEIELTSDVKQTLDFCLAHHVQLGIITNGPNVHQRKKVNQLALERWIPEQHIIISSEVGFAKPALEIFQLAEEIMGLNKQETYYVGDSYHNDMVGAKRAGWKTIWCNRRDHPLPANPVKIDYHVDSKRTLLKTVHSIIT
ncbi:HAD family hydrolase [Amphibacillus sediminis]|uniref:HAD family hydrolase n=1 Tax=Amphibacillus sediminis TaxID=360185 RepID=UPI0008364B27|nr:HAD family hydrolase [Amphibacillus sediminis]